MSSLPTSDKYFAINYKGSGAAYVDSITIEYGSGEDNETPPVSPTIVITADNEQIINNTLDLNVGDSTTIAIQDTSGENINVTYESINPDIVEIDANGKITVKSEGVAQIKITDEDGSVTIITINATTKSNANSLTKTQRIIIISVCITIAVVSLSIGIFILVRHHKKIM